MTEIHIKFLIAICVYCEKIYSLNYFFSHYNNIIVKRGQELEIFPYF